MYGLRNGRRITRASAKYRWSDACDGVTSSVARIRICGSRKKSWHESCDERNGRKT